MMSKVKPSKEIVIDGNTYVLKEQKPLEFSHHSVKYVYNGISLRIEAANCDGYIYLRKSEYLRELGEELIRQAGLWRDLPI
jgi:hypothetical protein